MLAAGARAHAEALLDEIATGRERRGRDDEVVRRDFGWRAMLR
jgi:hypothetical protein